MSIIVTCGDHQVKMDLATSDQKTLETLCHEVQEKCGLHPDSFEFYDDYGKVDARSLQRALSISSAGEPCRLTVHRLPVWQKMHELEQHIYRLSGVTASVMQMIPSSNAMQDQILAKVAMMLSENDKKVEELHRKVDASIAPMVQQIALEQIDMKAKGEEIDGDVTDVLMRESIKMVDKKVNEAIVPMLQSMALEQMSMRAKLNKMEGSEPSLNASEAKNKAQALSEESKRTQSAKNAQDSLISHWTIPISSPSLGRHQRGSKLDSHMIWHEGSSTEGFHGVPYSSKKQSFQANAKHANSEIGNVALFAPQSLSLQKRVSGSRSAPFLPPV